jgi:hypothetical protein
LGSKPIIRPDAAAVNLPFPWGKNSDFGQKRNYGLLFGLVCDKVDYVKLKVCPPGAAWELHGGVSLF